jgi:hypothetical protein
MQMKKELAQIRPDVSLKNTEDEIHQMLCEVVAACSVQKATAQAWQAKFQAAAVDVDKLTGDLKRAQVRMPAHSFLIHQEARLCMHGVQLQAWYCSQPDLFPQGDLQTMQAEIARLKDKELLAALEEAE